MDNDNVVDMPTGSPVQGVAALLRERAQAGVDGDGDAGADRGERRAEEQQPLPLDDKGADGGAGETDQQIADKELLADDPTDGEATGTPGAMTLAELAENAGVTVEEIFNIKLPMADGRESMALGKLKDNVRDGARIDHDRENIEQTRTDFENEMIKARQELNEILKLLPELPPALVAKAQQAHVQNIDTERAALIDIKPEWADPATFQRAQDTILEAVSDYGFSRADLDLVADHRLHKMLFDFALMKQRVARANARVKEVRGEGQKRTTKRKVDANKQEQASSIKQAKQSSQSRDKVRGITEIFRSANR